MAREAYQHKRTRRESESVAAGLRSCAARGYPYLLWALWLAVVGSGTALVVFR